MKKRFLVAIGVAVLSLGVTACGAGNGTTSGNGTVTEGTSNNGTGSEDNASTDNNSTGNTTEGNTSGATDGAAGSVEITSALSAFESIWNEYSDDDMFAAVGGDFSAPVDNMPGAHPLDNKDSLTGSFYVPASMIDSVDEAATIMHMMNANTFTGAIVHVSDSKAFADEVKTNIEGTQWICGFPDELVVSELSDGYVLYAFGERSLIETFKTKVTTVFPSATFTYDVMLTQ